MGGGTARTALEEPRKRKRKKKPGAGKAPGRGPIYETKTKSSASGSSGSSSGGVGGGPGGPRPGPGPESLTLEITAPTHGTFAQGERIYFSGKALDSREGDLSREIEWQWNGQRAKGKFFRRVLPVGTHKVLAGVVNKRGETAEDQVEVLVEPKAAF